MATIAATWGMAKWYTLAFQCTMTSTSDSVSNTDLVTTSGYAALLGQTPPAPLKAFLTTTYANNGAAEAAFRAIGGRVVVRQIGGTAAPAQIVALWLASGPSVPALGLIIAGGASNEVLEIVISCPASGVA